METGTLNFVTGNSGTCKTKFIVKYLFKKFIPETDEFYLFTNKENFNFDYKQITNSFNEINDLSHLLKKLKENPKIDKKKLIIIDGYMCGVSLGNNKYYYDLYKFLYCDLKKLNTNIIIGCLLLFNKSDINMYDIIDNVYFTCEHFDLTIKLYHRFTKNTISLKEFTKLIKLNEDNKLLAIQNIQSSNIEIKTIKFDNKTNRNKEYEPIIQTLIYNRIKYKSELHLILGSNSYDKTLFSIKHIYYNIKNNFDKVFVLTDYVKYYKDEFNKEQIYTIKEYYKKYKYNIIKTKLKYKNITDLKNDIEESSKNYINNLLIIDLEDLDKLFNGYDIIKNSNNVLSIEKIDESDNKSRLSSYIGTNTENSSEKKLELTKKIVYFLLEKRHSLNITIILIAREYFRIDFHNVFLYMGFESDNKILLNNYNKFKFNYVLGFDLFKTINSELIKGKFLINKINYPNKKNMIKIISINYQNKLIKPKIHLLVSDIENKQINFIKKKLLTKINNYIDKTYILTPIEKQYYWNLSNETHLFDFIQIESVIEKITKQTKINQLLIIYYDSDTNRKLIENKNFIELLTNINKYNLTIIWSIKLLEDINYYTQANYLSGIHYDYIYLDNIDSDSYVKSTYESLNINLFDLNFYKILNKTTKLSNKYIMIKYKKGFYEHYNIDFVDIIQTI